MISRIHLVVAALAASALMAAPAYAQKRQPPQAQQPQYEQSGRYSVEQLNPQVRNAVLAAREAERLGMEASARARHAAEQAREAARRARANQRGYRVNPFPDDDQARIYEGGWNGARHGYGVLTFGAGSFAGDSYEGEFADSFIAGDGVYNYSGRRNTPLRYEGQSENEMSSGAGATFFRNGDRHVGLYAADNRNGPGVYYFADGARYEGEFVDDLRHGYGVQWSPDGQIESAGVWSGGELMRALR